MKFYYDLALLLLLLLSVKASFFFKGVISIYYYSVSTSRVLFSLNYTFNFFVLI